MCLIVDGRTWRHGMIDDPQGVQRSENAERGPVYLRFRDGARGKRLAQKRTEISLVLRHRARFLIEALADRDAVDGTPIGHDEALVTPLTAQHVIQQETVL